MEQVRIVGLIGTQEICRYSLFPKRPMEADELLNMVWKEYPHLKNETARIYVNGVPATRVQMGQTLYAYERE